MLHFVFYFQGWRQSRHVSSLPCVLLADNHFLMQETFLEPIGSSTMCVSHALSKRSVDLASMNPFSDATMMKRQSVLGNFKLLKFINHGSEVLRGWQLRDHTIQRLDRTICTNLLLRHSSIKQSIFTSLSGKLRKTIHEQQAMLSTVRC